MTVSLESLSFSGSPNVATRLRTERAMVVMAIGIGVTPPNASSVKIQTARKPYQRA